MLRGRQELPYGVPGIRVVKGFRRGEDQVARFREQVEALRAWELRKARLLGGVSALVTVLPGLAAAAALVLGAVEVARGRLSAGSLLAFLGTLGALAPVADRAGPMLAQCHDAAAAADRYFEVMDEPAARAGTARAGTAGAGAGRGGVRGPAELVVDGVGFRHPGAAPQDPAALQGVTLRVAPGETLAVVGATGSGKTTLALLIAGLYEPGEGRILLDGADIAAMGRAELRCAVAVAFDEPVLFSGTLADNVTMGAEADQARLLGALRSVRAEEFVADLPAGTGTRVGENGMSLSGGQRQRIALARVMVGRPRVVVLDDPLSALDVRTEARIHDALREVLAATTAVVVAHRPSTALLADRVVLLAGGRVAAVGTHEELLRTSARYAALMTPLEAPAGREDAP